jgi:hypothetical protein
MGQKNPRRSEADPSKRPHVSRSPKVEHPARSLFIPAALFVGFVIGTFFGRPLFFSPLAESTSPIEQSPDSESKPKSPEKKDKSTQPQGNPAAKSQPKWDEKTIRSLSLSEVRSQLSQLPTWSPGAAADQVEHWLVQRWASL